MITPEETGFVQVSASSRAGVPSGKKRFPFAQEDWVDEKQNLIRKPVLEHIGVSVELPQRMIKPLYFSDWSLSGPATLLWTLHRSV
jgi:hypothetical protein